LYLYWEYLMMFQKWILLAALGLAAPAMAEELHYNVAEFSESASVRVPNDTMSVTLRVVESGASREAVSNKVTKRVNAVLARAKANRAFEVESGSRSVYPEYDEKRVGIKGWTDSADIYVKSTDFAALSKLVADSQQDAMLGDVSFSVSPKKYAAAVDEASEQALRSFRTRAQNFRCYQGPDRVRKATSQLLTELLLFSQMITPTQRLRSPTPTGRSRFWFTRARARSLRTPRHPHRKIPRHGPSA